MTKAALGPGHAVIDGEKLATTTIEFDGERYTVRELTADESNDIGEACTGPDGKFNNRLNTRMLLSKALVTPETAVDGVGKFGNRKFLTILDVFNKLNNLPEERDGVDPTAPAGSAEPTSPAGGEQSPTT